MGGSYGGYLVLAALAFQPDLWTAGADLMGIASLVSYLENTAPYRRAIRECEYGYLETQKQLLESLSPLNHVDAIRAPLLIIHGKNDPKVPVTESEAIYEATRRRGLPSELVVYDDEGHGFAHRTNRDDAYRRILGFLERHLA